jgi:excisionase family DNA binding protein
MANNAVLPTLLTVSEIARYLNVTADSVYRWIDAGRLPAVRLSPAGPLRVRSDHFAEWLERKVTTGVR